MPQKLPPRESERDLSRRYGVRSAEAPADRATWDLTYDKPANLEALDGTEGIDNALVTIDADGTLKLDGSGSGQIDALQVLNAPAEAGATAGADWNSNVANKPTIGALAAEDEISDTLFATGFAPVSYGSGAPASTLVGFYYDSSGGVAWFGDGSTITRLSTETDNAALGSDRSHANTVDAVVLKASFSNVRAGNRLTVIDIDDTNFLEPTGNQASAATATCDVKCWISNQNLSVGDNVQTGEFRQMDGGSTSLTFHAPVSDVEVVSNTLPSLVGATKTVDSRLAGTVYVYVTVKVTSGGGETINIDAGADFDAAVSP